MAEKVYSDTFVGEIYRFDSEEARRLFRQKKNVIGAGALMTAKKENGTLTVSFLETLLAARPQEEDDEGHNRWHNVTEDGEFVCSGKHAAGDKRATFKARGRTPVKADGQPVVSEKTGQSVRFGNFFKVGRQALEKQGLAELVPSMEATTALLLGITFEEAQKKEALAGAMCGMHNGLYRKAGLFFFTDKERILEQLEESETFYAERASKRAVAEGETELIARAMKAREDAKADKANKFGQRGGSGRGSVVEFPFAGTMLSAPVYDRRFKAALESLVAEYRGRELEFANLDPSTLVLRGVPVAVAPGLLRRVKAALAEATSGGATLGERAASDGDKKAASGRRRSSRREGRFEKTPAGGRRDEKERGGARNLTKEATLEE